MRSGPIAFRHSRTAAVLVSLVALVAPEAHEAGAVGHWMPSSEARVPTNYDIRHDLFFEPAAPSSSQVAAAGRLAAQVAGLERVFEDASALPRMVAATGSGARLTKGRRSEPVEAAREFLADQRELYRLAHADVRNLQLVYVSKPAGGATTVRLGQRIKGIPVFGAEIAVVMDASNHVVATSGTVYPDLQHAELSGSLSMQDRLVRVAA